MKTNNYLITAFQRLGKEQSQIIEDLEVSQPYVSALMSGKKPVGKKMAKKLVELYGFDLIGILTGDGEMLNTPESIITKNGYEHVQIGENLYMMKVPLLNIPAQAGFADNYQDVEYLSNVSEFHSVVVNEVHKGRYFAFVARNDSMDNGTSESIMPNSIVTVRELIREHWSDKLWYTKRPYWVIATKQSSYPLLKQIIDHNTEKGLITCHSLNDAPEYQDFELSMNDITGLFYVVDISRKV